MTPVLSAHLIHGRFELSETIQPLESLEPNHLMVAQYIL
jgi:hypothetical protein